MKTQHQLTNFLAGIQWLGFMFANIVVIPLSIGAAFDLSLTEISGIMSRSFIFTGLACLFQIFLDHRLPLMEGQSGIWWGAILSLCSVLASTGISIVEIGGSLTAGILISSVIIFLLGLLKLHKLLIKLFTPVVMAVVLFLLGAQLISIFFKGMIGLNEGSTVNIGLATLSISIAIFVSALTVAGRGLISNFSILIGLVAGWAAYALFFGNPPIQTPEWADIMQTFVWGELSFNLGIIVATIMIALINTTNTIATLQAAEPVFETKVTERQYQSSFTITALFTGISGIFSMVPYAPYTSSIGFLKTTRLLNREPFIIGAVLFTAFGIIPPLVGFFASLPISIGSAVLFVAYLQLFGSALRNIEGMHFDFRSIYRIAVPTLTGIAVLSTPAEVFSSLPSFTQAIFGNGMLVGIILAVILENCYEWDKGKLNEHT